MNYGWMPAVGAFMSTQHYQYSNGTTSNLVPNLEGFPSHQLLPQIQHEVKSSSIPVVNLSVFLRMAVLFFVMKQK